MKSSPISCLKSANFTIFIGHEGPEGKQMYSSTLSLTSALGGDGWSTSHPGPLTSGKDPVPIVQEAGWAPGQVWTGAENLAPTGIRSPTRSARSESLYRLSYPGPLPGFFFFGSATKKSSCDESFIRNRLVRQQRSNVVIFFGMAIFKNLQSYKLLWQKFRRNTSLLHCILFIVLRPPACWDGGFESRRGQGGLSLVSVVCCKVEVCAPGWSLVQRGSTECGLCVIVKPRYWGALGTLKAIEPWGKKRKILVHSKHYCVQRYVVQ